MEWQASHFSPWKTGYDCEIKGHPPLIFLNWAPPKTNQNRQHRTLYRLAILSMKFILHFLLKKSYPLNQQHRTLYRLAILSMKFILHFLLKKSYLLNRQYRTLYRLAILSIHFILHFLLKKSYPLNRQHRTLYFWLQWYRTSRPFVNRPFLSLSIYGIMVVPSTSLTRSSTRKEVSYRWASTTLLSLFSYLSQQA